MGVSELMEKYEVRKHIGTAVGAAGTAWQWLSDRMWPVCSAAVVISVFRMIAVASEKQTLADTYFGAGSSTEDMEELVKDSKKLYNEELAVAVKERVWQMPKDDFLREHKERHGSS